MIKSKSEKMKDLAKVRKHKIIIQKKVTSENIRGDHIQDWTDWKTLRAERSTLYGRDYYAAATVSQEQTIIFTVKYVQFLEEVDTVKYRIIYQNKPYDIKQIDFIQDDGMFAKIKVLESRLNASS